MNLQQLARLREGVYRFASAGFSYPTAELPDVAAGTVAVLDDLGLFDYAFALPIVHAAQTLADADVGDLQVAHAALFEAGVGGAACSPHATTYIADARTGGVARAHTALRATYRRLGVGDDVGDDDMIDHVATETEVMARLCGDEVMRRTEHRDPCAALRLQYEFLTMCLEPWLPTFTQRVCDTNREPAYSALAAALHALLEHDRDLLPLLLDPVETR